MASFFQNLLNLIFPPLCVSCGKIGKYLCLKCFEKIKFIKNPICPICERPSFDGLTHPTCQKKYSLDGLYCACEYQGTIKETIHKFKFGGVYDLADTLADLICHNLPANFSESDFAITPIPLHRVRKMFRGFNQAEILAQKLSQRLKLSYLDNLLERPEYTLPQARLDMETRKTNIKNAFAINQKVIRQVADKTKIIVVDDVWTTGETMRTAASVLKHAGFKKVYGLTLAR